MKIFVAGADGFIGRHLVQRLVEAGHEVTGGVRRRRESSSLKRVEIDFVRDLSSQVWAQRLGGIEVVVNAVGIARTGGGQTYEVVHHQAPRALFDGCVAAGVRRVIQISALGAGEGACSFQRTKRCADEYLGSLPIESVIVRPSLVIGRGAASSGLFAAMAVWPVLFLPGRGQQEVQPIGIDDLVRGLVALVESDQDRVEVDAVGPVPVAFVDVLRSFRRSLGLGRAFEMAVPIGVVRRAVGVGQLLWPRAPMSAETIDMLDHGNTADPGPWQRLTDNIPGALEQALEYCGAGDRLQARLFLLTPLLRLCLAFIWVGTGLICLFAYPVADSYKLILQAGGSQALAPWLLYGLSLFDLALGVATVVRWHVRPVLLIQAFMVISYSVMLMFVLPEFWWHPFGPLTKNIPLVGATLVAWALEDQE